MLVKHPEDQLNVVRAVTAPFITFLPFVVGFPPGYEVLTWFFLWCLINDLNHVLHLHIHNPFTTSRPLNLLLDLSMGFATAMTASNWRIQHKLSHHNPRVGELCKGKPWEIQQYSITGAISYSARTAPPIFLKPIAEAFRKGVLANRTRPINYRWGFAEQALFVCFVLGLLVWKPTLTISYLLPLYVLTYFVTRYTDYLNHVGCGGDEIHEIANNCLNPTYNRLGNNFGFHTAHHLHPNAHWTTLPDLHREIEHLIPAERRKHYSWSGFLLPLHFLRSLQGDM